MKKEANGRFKRIMSDKIKIIAVLFFIFALFLLDVNVNMLAVYGPGITVPVISDIRVAATSMFWLGFLVASLSFFIISIRAMYHQKRIWKKIDRFFVIIGIIGLGIILSGGLLLFGPNDNLQIPFFKWIITRVTYYHIGIALTIIVVLYFALRK